MLSSNYQKVFLKLLLRIFRSNHSQVFCLNAALRAFEKLTGKHLLQSHYLLKLHVYNTQLDLKRDSNIGVFLGIMQNFSEQPFAKHFWTTTFEIWIIPWKIKCTEIKFKS